ncbi:MAG TPA: hypothetical protein VGJ60_14860 [Chloroflexota bacterium]
MALFLRTTTSLFLVLAFLSGASVAAADTLAQAATATPTPRPSGPTATVVPCVPPKVGVIIVLGNPQPYDTLISGTQVVMTGVAYDTRATSGTGVSQVTAYLGSRDAGGTSLGTALVGQSNPLFPSGSQFANAGFTLRTPSLPQGSGSRSIFVYAKSSVDSSEGVLEVPVYLNTAPTPVRGQVPTAVLPTPPPCTPTPAPTPTSPPTSTPVPVQAVATSTPLPTLPATPTPLSVVPPAPVPPAAPAAPAVTAPSPAAAAPAAAPAAAQTVAPRGGGVPSELGLIVLAVGSVIVGGGLALRRRERRP